MKVVWEAEDIVPGRVVGKAGRTERWFVGYLPWIEGEARYVIVSANADGMVTRPATKADIASSFNHGEEIPAELLDSRYAGVGGT